MSFAAVVVRWRAVVVVAVLATGAALVPLARRAERELDVSGRIRGSESAGVEEALATRFESPFAVSAVVVLSGVPAPDTEHGREALREAVAALAAVPGVARVYSYLNTRDPLFAGTGGGTFVVVGVEPSLSPDVIVPRLREAGRSVAARWQARWPAAAVRVTGEPALNLDFRRASAGEVRAAEARALPLTAVLLLVAFGTLAASLLPLLAGGLAVVMALGAAVLINGFWPLSATLQTVASMLGLGLGLDYALLTVSRFRESFARSASPHAAAEDACRHAGGTVALSGATVAIGFLGLLLVPVGELQSLGVGGLLVVGASVLLAVTLLPALLASLGARVVPRYFFTPSLPGRLPFGERGERGRWQRWGECVVRRPGWVLLVAGTPVLLLALHARRLSTELPRGDWLPGGMESTLAVRDLRAMGRSGIVQEVRVLLELPEDVSALSAEGWDAQRRLIGALAADPRVARVRSLRDIAGDRADDLAYVSFLPSFAKRCFVSGEGDAVLLGLVPREEMAPAELARLVRELRRVDAAALSGLPGARLRVGGLPAFNADYEDAVAARFKRVVALVVAGTFVALLLAFRSVLIPLKAVALNLLSVTAAFGAVVLVFQEGHGAALLGLAVPTGSVFPAVPLLVFAVVFGLSMDYEVFLVARVAEARRDGLDEGAAVVSALASTGGVITSAAAIMIAVFGSFAAGGFLLVKMLGFALAVAVLLDATVIRLAVGPSLLCLAGRWNWWPGVPAGLSRLPALDAHALGALHSDCS